MAVRDPVAEKCDDRPNVPGVDGPEFADSDHRQALGHTAQGIESMGAPATYGAACQHINDDVVLELSVPSGCQAYDTRGLHVSSEFAEYQS